MVSNSDYLDPDGFHGDIRRDDPIKWRVFKERLHSSWQAKWVVWDEHGEYLFDTGREAIGFVNWELKKRALARQIKGRQDALDD